MALNPSPQDKRGIVLRNFDNTFDAENYPLGNKPEGAQILFKEDFESTLKTGSTLAFNAEVVENQPLSGTKCCRVNVKTDAVDPYMSTTGEPRATYEYRGSVLAKATAPDVYTIRTNYRVDDATWEGSGGFTQSSPSQISTKGGYYGPAGEIVSQGFYTVLWGGASGEIRFGDNQTVAINPRGDAGWQDEPWADGRTIFYMSTNTNWGAGTGWFTVDMIVDTTNAEYNQVTLKVDGVAATNPAYTHGEIMRVPKTWFVEEFSSLFGPSTAGTDLSVDRTETACGIQFDDIEIFSGVPT